MVERDVQVFQLQWRRCSDLMDLTEATVKRESSRNQQSCRDKVDWHLSECVVTFKQTEPGENLKIGNKET